MREGRIGTSRETVDWAQIQPRPKTDLASDATWSAMDGRFLRLGLRGVRVLPTFTHAPSWANPGSPSQTQAPFADFLRAFAKRYGRGGTFWRLNNHLDESRLAVRDYEIWDRGNLNQSWWDKSARPGEYASAYAEAQTALHQVDSHARALVSLDQGGIGYARFIRDMVAARPGLAGHLDGAFVLATTSRSYQAVEAVVAAVRSELNGTGNSSAPIHVGFGWYVRGARAMTEGDRAAFYSQVASRLARSDCGVGGLLARSWVTPQGVASPSAWYGMVDPQTFRLGQTAQAYRNVARTYLGYGKTQAPRAVVHTCFPVRQVRTVPTAPVITSGPAPGSLTGPKPTFTFGARYATTFQCRFDGNAFGPCSGAHSHSPRSPLTNGPHTFEVRGIGGTGKAGPSTTRGFTVDAAPPSVRFRKRPRVHAHRRSAVVRFRVKDASAVERTECKLDRRRWRECDSPVKLRHLRRGKHRFRVRAVDEWGNASQPEKIRWRQPPKR
jgi:hypothetical protein